MDSPINPPNQNSQPSTGFSFPVTTVVDPGEALAQPVSVATTVSTSIPTPTPTPVTPTPVTTPIAIPTPTPVPVGTVNESTFTATTTNQTTLNPAPAVQPNGMSFTEQKAPSKTKGLVLVGLLLILLAGAVFGFTKVRSLLSSAAEDGCAPVDVTEQDLAANSIVINFTTSEACKMQVAYGVDEILGLQMSEQVMATDHRIKLSPLMPSTPYKYQIRNDESKYEPTRGFLTLPAAVVPTLKPTVVVPTRNLTPASNAAGAIPTTKSTGAVTGTPMITQTAVTVAPTAKFTVTDFQLHFGSVDPRFDTDKNGVVNIRDWQLYNK